MPNTKPIAKRTRGTKTYQLFSNGELWTTGEHAYRCGYVMNPENIDYAIDNHEQEMDYMMQQLKEEFGL